MQRFYNAKSCTENFDILKVKESVLQQTIAGIYPCLGQPLRKEHKHTEMNAIPYKSLYNILTSAF